MELAATRAKLAIEQIKCVDEFSCERKNAALKALIDVLFNETDESPQ